MKIWIYCFLLTLAPILFITCDGDLLTKINDTSSDLESQDARIDSLITLIDEQQKDIDSLKNNTTMIDSILTLIQNDSEVHVITGIITEDHYYTNDKEILFSNSNIYQDESLIQVQFKSPEWAAELGYSPYSYWPIQPSEMYSETHTLTFSKWHKEREDWYTATLSVPNLTESVINNGIIYVTMLFSPDDYWRVLPYLEIYDSDNFPVDWVANFSYSFLQNGKLDIDCDLSMEANHDWWYNYLNYTMKVKVTILPFFEDNENGMYFTYVADGAVIFLDEAYGHKIGWNYKLIIINP